MAFLALLLITAAFQLFQGLLQKSTQPKPEEQPKLPQIDGSKSIPVVFGECLITDAFMADYLDFQVKPIKIRNPATFFITTLTIGYRYYLGMIFGLCRSEGPRFSTNNPALKEILIDNRRALFTADVPTPSLNTFDDYEINKPSFFGSKNKEGGIAVNLRYYDGADPAGFMGLTKQADPYWESQAAITLPHYKDLAYAVWKGPSSGLTVGGLASGYIGNSTNLFPISFKVVRFPNYVGTVGTRSIGDTPGTNGPHANPIECLYEVLINDKYGAGIPTSQIKTASFESASSQVWSEGLAFSYLWNSPSTVETMVLEILRHCQAVLWTDLQTGLVNVALVREESLSGVPSYTDSDFIEITKFTFGSWEETRNEIKVTFPDHAKNDFGDETVTFFEVANFNIVGTSNVEAITYNGCPSTALANRLAAREGRALSQPLAQLQARIDRKAWLFRPATIFKFNFPARGVVDMPMRVTQIKFGSLENDVITLSAVQDVFRKGDQTFGIPGPTLWTDPLGGDAVDATGSVSEIPYLIQQDNFNRVFGIAARPDSTHISYDGSLDGTVDIIDVDFTPSGLFTTIYPQVSVGDFDATGIVVGTISDHDAIVAGTSIQITNIQQGLALIGNPAGDHEWIAFESFTDAGSTITVKDIWRGVIDTPPREWPSGTRIWFWSVASAMFVNVLSSGQTVNFEALTRTLRNQLLASSATDHNYTIQRRAFRALPPFYVRMGGSYTNERQDTGDLVFTWREHSRLTLLQVIKQSATTESPEAALTYQIDIYDASTATPVLIRAVTGLSSPTYTYLNTDELSDLGSATLATRLRLDFFSFRDSLRSLYPWQRFVFRVDPATFGSMTEDAVTMTEDAVEMVQL